ncbi:MAG: hypothetical protein AAGU74_15255, partial [Bacillota bacterium]
LHNPGILEAFGTAWAKAQEELKDYNVTPEGVRIPKDFKPASGLPEGYAYAPDGTPVPEFALHNPGILEAFGAAWAKAQEELKDYNVTPEGVRIPKDFKPASGLPEGYAYAPDGTPVPEFALHNPGILEAFGAAWAKAQEELKDYNVTPEGVRIPKDFKPASGLPEGYAYAPDGFVVPDTALKSTEKPEPISMAKQTGKQLETPNVPGYEEFDALLKEMWNKDIITAEDCRRIREAIEEIAPSIYKHVDDWDTQQRYAELLMQLPQTDFLGRLYKGADSVLENIIGSIVYGVEAMVQQSKNIQEGYNQAVEQYRGKAVRPEEIRIEPGTDTVPEDSIGSRLMKGSQKAADLATYGLSDAEKFTVNTTMSVVQSALGLVSILQAIGQTAYDIGQRGGSMTQQMQGGFAAGAVDYAVGKIFGDIVKSPALDLIVGSMGIGEQIGTGIALQKKAATEVMNTASDLFSMGDKPDLELYYKQFKSANPDADALWPTILKTVSQIGLSGLAGEVAGGMMSGSAQFVSRGTLQRMGGKMRSMDTVNELIETGKSLDPASSAYRMATRLETRVNAGKEIGDLDIGRQYAANLFAEEAEQLTAFQTDLTAAGMDQRTAKMALRVYDKLARGSSISERSAEKFQGGYDKLTQGESESKRAAAKLQASLRYAAAQKSEFNADFNVARTEAIIRLRPLYTAVQRAAQTGDFAAFQIAKEQYAHGFALEQAKYRAEKVRAQNRINAIDNDVRTEISDAETAVKEQPTVAEFDNGFEDGLTGPV